LDSAAGCAYEESPASLLAKHDETASNLYLYGRQIMLLISWYQIHQFRRHFARVHSLLLAEGLSFTVVGNEINAQ
jgi:hypothetical protein